MNHETGAHPSHLPSRNRHRRLGLLMALHILASPRVWAQHGHAAANTAPATLRISVFVVPVAMLPPSPQSQGDAGSGITFLLPGPSPAMTKAEEIRLMPAHWAARLSAGVNPEGALLRTLTVVAR